MKMSPYVCEFWGTFVLAFTFTCCGLNANPSFSATCVACALMVVTYAVGEVSGGNFNPAVSIMLGVCRKRPWSLMIKYIVVQIIGGILAAALTCLIFQHTYPVVHPAAPYGWWSVAFVEIVYTTVLCFVVGNCQASTQNNFELDRNQFFGLAIGFVLIAGIYAGGSISGAIFNPAIAFGLGITSFKQDFLNSLAYSGLEVVGGVLSAGLFCLCRVDEFRPIKSPFVDLEHLPALWRRCLCEFLGAFVLATTVCLNIVTMSTATAWSAAAAMMSMLYSVGGISAGFFNPAIGFAMLLCGRTKITSFESIVYMFVELMGCALAGLLVACVHSEGPYALTTFGLSPQSGHTWASAMMSEVIFTFLIAYVVLAVATTPPASALSRVNNYFALAIGMCVTVGGIAAGRVSGGILNPAVALSVTMVCGIAVTPSSTATETTTVSTSAGSEHSPQVVNLVWYSLFEIVGGVLAAIVFHGTHAHEFRWSRGRDSFH